MSFILDALRKSETERQKQSTPGLVDTHYSGRKARRSVWLPLLVIILAVNAAVITALLLNDDSAPTAAGEPPVATEVQPSTPAARSEEPAVRPLYREAAAGQKVSRPAPVDPPEPAAPAAEQPKPAIDTEPNDAGLPSLQQLSAAGLVSLPKLHVDIHVYSPDPEQRFVFVNMNKYREGEVMKEGPKIESITQTGAVLSHQGNRFTLERE